MSYISGNVRNKELTIVQRRILRKWRMNQDSFLIFFFLIFFAATEMYMNFPFYFHLCIFAVMYYLAVYLGLYILTKYSRDATLIFQFRKKEKEKVDFFLQVVFLVICFSFFVFAYTYFQGVDKESTKEDLVNPLQALLQLTFFLFFFRYPEGYVKERRLALICMYFAVVSTLYILQIGHPVLQILITLISLYMFLSKHLFHYVPLMVLVFYQLDARLAGWSFFLLFQQVSFYIICRILDKEQNVPPRDVVKKSIILLGMQFLLGIMRGDCYFAQPTRLLVLISGASIVFLCIKQRSQTAFFVSFLVYLGSSVIIGIASFQSPVDWTGLLIFLTTNLLFFVGLGLFVLPNKKKSLVPYLFFALCYFLPDYPTLEFLSKWLEGFDLLLFGLVLLEEAGSQKGGQGQVGEKGSKGKGDPPLVNKKMDPIGPQTTLVTGVKIALGYFQELFQNDRELPEV